MYYFTSYNKSNSNVNELNYQWKQLQNNYFKVKKSNLRAGVGSKRGQCFYYGTH